MCDDLGERHITLSQTETGRETEAEMLVLCGSSEWVLPGAAILSPSDNRGCLLGKKTAEQLLEVLILQERR